MCKLTIRSMYHIWSKYNLVIFFFFHIYKRNFLFNIFYISTIILLIITQHCCWHQPALLLWILSTWSSSSPDVLEYLFVSEASLRLWSSPTLMRSWSSSSSHLDADSPHHCPPSVDWWWTWGRPPWGWSWWRLVAKHWLMLTSDNTPWSDLWWEASAVREVSRSPSRSPALGSLMLRLWKLRDLIFLIPWKNRNY